MPYIVPPQALQKKTATVDKKTTTSTNKSKRIDLLPSARTVETIAKVGAVVTGVGVTVATGGAIGPVAGLLVGKALYNNFDNIYKNPNNGYGSNDTAEQKARRSNTPPRKYEYNLPPHQWSLPVRTIDVQGGKTPLRDDGSETMSDNTTIYSRPSISGGDEIHRTRRGVIWNWDTGDTISVIDEKGSVTTAYQAAQKKGLVDKPESPQKNSYSYGFQFPWNPESISMSVERNMDVTPSPVDKFRTVIGAFPGMQNYNFTIMLDRVNDFACIKSIAGMKKSADLYGRTRSSGPSFGSAHGYYKYSLYEMSPDELNRKLYDLSRLGTLADLEYLFRAINGKGVGESGEWQTLLKKKSADIGFLSPTLLAFRLGPDATESISFVGWITNLSVNHTYFTEEMVPLRTQVSISAQAFAGSSLV